MMGTSAVHLRMPLAVYEMKKTVIKVDIGIFIIEFVSAFYLQLTLGKTNLHTTDFPCLLVKSLLSEMLCYLTYKNMFVFNSLILYLVHI